MLLGNYSFISTPYLFLSVISHSNHKTWAMIKENKMIRRARKIFQRMLIKGGALLATVALMVGSSTTLILCVIDRLK